MPEIDSPLLDVVIALAFVFFLLSIICSGILEFIAARLRLRSKDLESAIREMLADDSKAEAVLNHPQVKSLALKRAKLPSYISSRSFALAVIDTLVPPQPQTSESRDVMPVLRDQIAALPAPLQQQLRPLLDAAEDDVAEFRSSIETWFDDSMDRVSEWYKRRSQWIILAIAVVVTIGLNVSAVRVVDRLWNDSTVRTSVVGAATQTVTEAGVAATDTSEPPTAAEAGAEVKEATAELASLSLPIGWGEDNRDWLSFLGIGGWALTIGAIWLGAPFWFQLLTRLAPLRSAGPAPATRSG